MHPLMQGLAAKFRAVALDWPGFRTAPRPGVRWTPDALSAFLRHALNAFGSPPNGVVAAGHACACILHHGADHPRFADRIVLVAPPWRGLLATMVGGDRPFFSLGYGVS